MQLNIHRAAPRVNLYVFRGYPLVYGGIDCEISKDLAGFLGEMGRAGGVLCGPVEVNVLVRRRRSLLYERRFAL